MDSAGSFHRDVVRKSRACIPCHERKVGCNASQAGLPCTRCIKGGKSGQCKLVRLQGRSAGRLQNRKRSEAQAAQEQAQSRQPLPSIPEVSRDLGEENDLQISGHVDTTSLPICAPDTLTNNTSPPSIPGYVTSAPGIGATRPVLADSDAETVSEEDTQLETCRKIAQWDDVCASPLRIGHPAQGQEILEYHDGVNSTTILGELFGQRNPRRFVRILLREPVAMDQGPKKDIENANMDFLQRRGAFLLPPRSTSERLLRLYFECVYPYTPVLDRIDFMRQFTDSTCSTFLLQCILTSVAPYMPRQLILETGHADRFTAQRTFFSRAQLLYDLGAEKSQPCLLQGSLVLTSSFLSFGLDKDCRFWLANAVRLATQMGLHRKQIADQLDSPTRKLFTRLFWVLYNRDVLMAIAGSANVRRLNDCYCDVAEVTVDDWEEEGDIERFQHVLSPITHLHKSYLVQNTRLSRICARFLETFGVPNSTPSQSACNDLEEAIFQWKRALPPELHTEIVEDWSHENVWILVLRAMSYRLEFVFYRNVRELYKPGEESSIRRALQKQQNAMLELDAILNRIMLYNLVSSCPLSITTCASTVVAMHIEIALSPSFASPQGRANRTHIHNGLAYLRASSEHWQRIRWTLRMFEVVVARTGLLLSGPDHCDFDVTSMSPFVQKRSSMSDEGNDGSKTSSDHNIVTGVNLIPEAPNSAWSGFPSDTWSDVANADLSCEPMMLGENPEKWLNDLFAENVFGMNIMQPGTR